MVAGDAALIARNRLRLGFHCFWSSACAVAGRSALHGQGIDDTPISGPASESALMVAMVVVVPLPAMCALTGAEHVAS